MNPPVVNILMWASGLTALAAIGVYFFVLARRPQWIRLLNGSGLFVLNPPWTLGVEAEAVLPALAERFSRSGYGAFRADPFGPAA